ncbi:MAG: glycosyltransferase [Saprospiraceae bacterium]
MPASGNIISANSGQFSKNGTPPNGHLISLPMISIISSERYPHHDTNTQQVVKNASALHEAGVPVELVLPSQAQGFFDKNFHLDQAVYDYYNIPKGLKIREFKSVPASDYRFEKIFHSIFSTLQAIFKKDIQVIYTRNRTSALLAFLFGKPLIFETYRRLGDEFPRAMKWLAKRSRNNAFIGMVLHSQVSADSMEKVGFPKEKLFVLHNGYDPTDMQPVLTKKIAREKLGLSPSEQYIVYTGNMQKNKCIEVLLDIAIYLPKVKFLLVGGREEDLERLKMYGQEIGLQGNVIFTGRQPISVVSEYLYAADVLIIPPVSAPLEKFGRTVLPFKIFPYLAAGRPIVAPDLADMRELLQHQKNAILVKPDNPEQNAESIDRLLKNKELQQSLAENAANLSASLTWLERGRKFKKWIAERWALQQRTRK